MLSIIYFLILKNDNDNTLTTTKNNVKEISAYPYIKAQKNIIKYTKYNKNSKKHSTTQTTIFDTTYNNKYIEKIEYNYNKKLLSKEQYKNKVKINFQEIVKNYNKKNSDYKRHLIVIKKHFNENMQKQKIYKSSAIPLFSKISIY